MVGCLKTNIKLEVDVLFETVFFAIIQYFSAKSDRRTFFLYSNEIILVLYLNTRQECEIKQETAGLARVVQK